MSMLPTDDAALDDEDLFSRVAQLLRRFEAEGNQDTYQRELQAARAELRRYYNDNPASVPALRLLAECAQRLFDLKAARKYICEAELLDPWDLEILIISESLYEAEAAGKKARPGEPLRLQSDLSSGVVSTETLLEKAMGSFRLGDLERAYSLAKLTYRINPVEEHHLMDIWAIGSAFDPNRTRAELIKLEQEGDPSPYLYLALGSVCNVVGQYQEAVYWIDRGISLSPKDPFVLAMLFNELAYVLAKQELHLDRCVQLARTALELFPDSRANGFIRDTLGVVYLKRKDFDKAIGNLREAVRKDPTVIPRFHLALALLHQRDAASALAELKFIAAARPSLESPHVEETAILERVQSHLTRLEDLLNLGGADDIRDALTILEGLV
jgi:tetratricopeptide (TPR) repeat protein